MNRPLEMGGFNTVESLAKQLQSVARPNCGTHHLAKVFVETGHHIEPSRDAPGPCHAMVAHRDDVLVRIPSEESDFVLEPPAFVRARYASGLHRNARLRSMLI